MIYHKKISKFILLGGLVLTCGLLQSCEDFLTLYPTNQITQEEFWKDRVDVDNVRSAAYKTLIDKNQIKKILYWGEARSSDLTLNEVQKTNLLYLQDGILIPTDNMFDWSGFYKGINQCNLVLEEAQNMVDKDVDPSFSESDWRPIKSEMQALRALYYFYLVKAFRNVPYVKTAYTTDVQAQKARVAAMPGVAILGDLIDTLEVAKKYAADNFGKISSNKGRFTKKSIYTLLADMYLWRGCLLKHFFQKGGTMVNVTDVASASSDGKTTVYKTADGKVIDKNYTEALSKDCFKKAIDNCNYVLTQMTNEYRLKVSNDPTIPEKVKTEPYPLIQLQMDNGLKNVVDNVYYDIFGAQNSSESILELQYDGVENSDAAYNDVFSAYSNGKLSSKEFTVNQNLINKKAVDPDRGFGKTDIRYLENVENRKAQLTYAYLKNILTSYTISDLEDVSSTDNSTQGTYRTASNQNANFPIYRLSDLMLIKAEAIARFYGAGNTKNNNDLYDGFDMVNYIFQRSNPALKASNVNGATLTSDRLIFDRDYDNHGKKYYGKDKSAYDLLHLVYRERQREFLGEGKFWFDLVRQAEYSNNSTSTLSDYMSLTTSLKNKLRDLYSLYNPIFSEEMKVNGVDNGGKLVQNPVWDRYSKK